MRTNGLFGAFALTLAVTLLPTAVILQSEDNALNGDGESWQEMLVSRILPKLDRLTGFDAIGQIIDATIEEDCAPLSCPNGISTCTRSFMQGIKANQNVITGFTRTANPLYVSTSNGCGTLGFQVTKYLIK